MSYLLRKLNEWLDKTISAVERQTADRPMSKEMAEAVRQRGREWDASQSKPTRQEHPKQER